MQYYYQQNGQQQGPVDIEQLKNSGITPDTYIWHEGMANWQKASELPELAQLFIVPPTTATPPQTSKPQRSIRPESPLCPATNLVWAILVTVLCCMPLGVVSIVYAAKVEGAFYRGAQEDAERYSKMARNWAIAGAVTSLVLIVLISLIYGVAIFSAFKAFDML